MKRQKGRRAAHERSARGQHVQRARGGCHAFSARGQHSASAGPHLEQRRGGGRLGLLLLSLLALLRKEGTQRAGDTRSGQGGQANERHSQRSHLLAQALPPASHLVLLLLAAVVLILVVALLIILQVGGDPEGQVRRAQEEGRQGEHRLRQHMRAWNTGGSRRRRRPPRRRRCLRAPRRPPRPRPHPHPRRPPPASQREVGRAGHGLGGVAWTGGRRLEKQAS